MRPIAVVGAAAALLLSACDPPPPWRSRLVTVNADGTDAANQRSDAAVISPDGTTVAFSSWADDFGPHDTNNVVDVYVRDLAAGTSDLVSVNAAGDDSANGRSVTPRFSPDGTKVLFVSTAYDLGPPDPSSGSDVYVRDLATGVTTRVSVDDSTGEGLGNAAQPVFSPDGTAVAFATRIGAYSGDVYVKDLVTGDLTLISVDAAGTGGGDRRSSDPVFSPDGTKVAFSSHASNLGPADTNGRTSDVYVRDLVAGTTALVSADATGTGSGNALSHEPAFSPDGTTVGFLSYASNLGPADTNGTGDIYLRDLASQITTLVSANATGTDAGNGASGERAWGFSPDGTGLAFDSAAADLGPTDTNGARDTYYRDLTTGVTTLVSATAGGADSGNGQSLLVGPGFGPIGRRVVFSSSASDLGPNDTNGQSDLYVHDLATGVATLVSANVDGADGATAWFVSEYEQVVSFSDDGRQVAYLSAGSTFGDTDTNGHPDVYIATLTD